MQDFGRPKSLETVFKIANPTNETVRYTLDGNLRALDLQRALH